MRKYYSEPELEIRKYAIAPNQIFTDSGHETDLEDDDEFGDDGANAKANGFFADDNE